MKGSGRAVVGWGEGDSDRRRGGIKAETDALKWENKSTRFAQNANPVRILLFGVFCAQDEFSHKRGSVKIFSTHANK